MAPADQCQVCSCRLAPGDGHFTVIRRSERIPRAALQAPGGEHFVFRTKSHAVFDEPSFVCIGCRDALTQHKQDARAYLRTATLRLAIVALMIMVIGCAYAYCNPTAGPQLVRYVWHDPWAKPQPDPTYKPYKPPF